MELMTVSAGDHLLPLKFSTFPNANGRTQNNGMSSVVESVLIFNKELGRNYENIHRFLVQKDS